MGIQVQFEPIHFIIKYFYLGMVALIWIYFILSLIAPSLPNIPTLMRIYSVVSKLTDPLLEPLRRRMPRISLGIFDVGGTIALIFCFWALHILTDFMIQSLPNGW